MELLIILHPNFQFQLGKKNLGKKKKLICRNWKLMRKYMEKLDGLGWEEPLYNTSVSIFCESVCYNKSINDVRVGDKNNGAPNNSTSQFSVSAGKKSSGEEKQFIRLNWKLMRR
ncbi:hypothetical protein H5410_004592 [Solanum commersonii]|uniref:Uncharacterized protein n=1 Tax=Solanum commersonii TaxID=4109 RepID=A0A9J6B8F2_SOLCO|nr:hypothetical protein H5410_004592 [Solanum commersonii]